MREAMRESIGLKNSSTFSGRSVVCSEKEIGGAFSKLQAILRTNNVIAELRRTERHEKKGVKRRRLRSERWRRRFAHEARSVQMFSSHGN